MGRVVTQLALPAAATGQVPIIERAAVEARACAAPLVAAVALNDQANGAVPQTRAVQVTRVERALPLSGGTRRPVILAP